MAQAVGTKQPNEQGLYDMSGNVYEWCQDWKGNYRSGSQTNPTGISHGSDRVCRDGGWSSGPWRLRVSFRHRYSPGDRLYDLGLRLALYCSIEPECG